MIGFVDERALTRGFVQALAEACRIGVPSELRADLRAYQSESGPRFVDEAAGVRARLEAEIEAGQRVKDNALKGVQTARSAAIVARLVEAAEGAEATVARFTEQLARLDHASDVPVGADTFDASVDVLMAGMRRLLEVSRLTREEHDSLRRLVSSLRLRPVADGWCVEAYVRLVVADGLAVLGPITWTVLAERVGVGAMRAGVREQALPVLDNVAKTEHMLVHDAGVTKLAAHVLVGAPFPELAQLVLHARAGTPLPEWVSAEWREPQFVQHTVGVYTDLEFDWSRAYGRLSVTAQAIVDCTAEAGQLTLEAFRERYPAGSAGDLWRIAVENYRDPRAFARRPPVHMGRDEAGVRFLSSVMCSCGLAATTLARGPEIPGSLLCTCGRAPHAAPGSPARQVVFPSVYQRLRVSEEAGVRALRRRHGRRGDPLTTVTPGERGVLLALLSEPEPDRWRTVDEIGERCEMPHKAALLSLERLRRRDFTRRDAQQRRYALVQVDEARAVLTRSSPRGD